LKHRFLDLAQVAFWAGHKAEKDVGPGDIALSKSPCQGAGQEAENEFSEPSNHLKHRFLDHALVPFFDGRNAENEFSGSVDNLKHYFLSLAHVAFSVGQKAENEFTGLVDPLTVASSTTPK
jgi:hypothetical protein